MKIFSSRNACGWFLLNMYETFHGRDRAYLMVSYEINTVISFSIKRRNRDVDRATCKLQKEGNFEAIKRRLQKLINIAFRLT